MDSFALDGRFADADRFPVARDIKSGLEKGGLHQDQLNPNLVICIGGDGSLLKSLNTRGYSGNYLLVNGGTLGFMGEYRIGEAQRVVYDVLNSTPLLDTHVPLVFQTGRGHRFYAANDVSLIAPIRAINFDILINDERLSSVQGSGLVVATELGSTAFQLSLGGPVMLTRDDSFVFSLVAALKNRVTHTCFDHAVLPKEDVLKIKIEQNSRLYKVATDGIEIHGIDGHEFSFYVSKAKRFNLVSYHQRSAVRRIAAAFGK